MFIFIAEFKPKEWFNNAGFQIDVGSFAVQIQLNRISCLLDYGYITDFDSEIKQPAMLAMECVQLAQLTETNKKLSIDYIAWVEIKLRLNDVIDKFTLGHFLIPSEFRIENKDFLSKFASGVRFSNQAFIEINMRVALEDYARAIDSDWDEAIYHCQHCLEAVRDYFGRDDVGWQEMRQKLDVDEKTLREVTDFSNKFIRHGSSRLKLRNLNQEEKSLKVAKCKDVCHAVLGKFGDYLHEHGIPLAKVRTITP